MKNAFTNKLKIFLILVLATFMAFSTMMSYACKKDSSSSTSSSSTTEEESITEKTDYQVLKNGDFEYGTANTKPSGYPASPTGWSKSYDSINSTNATTSSYGSGIIDTREYKYEYDEDGNVKKDSDGNYILAKDEDGNYTEVFKTVAAGNAFPKYAYEYTTDADGNRVYTKDADGNYIPKLDADGKNVEATSDDTEYFYYNPGTPFSNGYVTYDTTDKTNTSEGGKILMIHNRLVSDEGRGTAQYYKSSTTLTLKAGENGLLEVWVLTKDLTSKMEGVDFGAYITVSSKISSTSAGDVSLNNINTYGEWAKVEIYVQGSTYATTELTITLGLGRGNSAYKYEYVEGFAFFDDAHFKVLKSTETMPAVSTTLTADLYPTTDNVLSTDAVKIAYNHTESEFASATGYLTTTMKIDAVKQEDVLTLSGGTETKETTVYPQTSSIFNVGATAELTADNKIVFDYTNPSTLSFETSTFTVDYQKNLRIAFWVKTEISNFASNGLTINLLDKGKTSTSKGTSTSVLSNFKTTKNSDKDHDDYTLVSVIVSNTYSDDARYFSLKFTFGASETVNDLNLLPKGKATIKDFTQMYLTDDETGAIASSTDNHITKTTLQEDYATTPSESETSDTYTFNCSYTEKTAIKTGTADIQNYTGKVGGESIVYEQDSTQSGLINSQYINDYQSTLFTAGGVDYTTEIKNWLAGIENDSDNKYVQPLMINNENSSYGYVGENLTLSTSSTYLISLKVKIFGNATAYIYLANADTKDFSVLGVDPITNTYTNETVTEGQYGYCISLNASDVNANQKADGFATVYFLITTGKHDSTSRNYRIEMWNGSRDGQSLSTGIVFFDSFLSTTSTNRESNLRDLKYTYVEDNAYSYEKAETNKVTFTQLPTLIKTNDAPNGTTKYYTKGDKDHTSTIFMTNGTLENGIVKNGTFIISDLTSVDAPTEEDNTTSTDSSSSSDSSDTESTSYNPFLFATSLIISVVLIIALVAVLVKHIISSAKKKKMERENYYDLSSRDKAHEKILNKKSEQKKAYDYDNIENNIDEESTSDQNSEETIQAEETTEQAEETSTENASEADQVTETVENAETDTAENTETEIVDSTENTEVNPDGETQN